MAENKGVGKPRPISGKLYYPICYRFQGREVINTSVKALSEGDAFSKLELRIADFHSKPKETGNILEGLEKARAELREDVSGLTNKKDRDYLSENTFTRVFIDFPTATKLNISSCLNLPKGYFKKYKYYFCEVLKRTGWRAEIIRVKSMIKRLNGRGYCSDEDLKQVLGETTPDGIPIPKPKASEKQLETLFAYIKKDRPDYYKPIKFMAMTGRRPKETCGIAKEDLTTDGLNPLSIQTKPKSAKVKSILPKIIYLKDPELNALIRSALANNKTDWLFPTRHGKKMTANYLWKYLSDVSQRVIGAKVTAKGFRKLFLTKSNIEGLNPISMQMANISSVSVMMKYYVGSSEEAQAKLLAKNRGDNV